MRFDGEFLQIFVILGCFGPPILRPFGTNRGKKGCPEKRYKKCGKTGVRGNWALGLWALKTYQYPEM